ncbi:MAG: hypothetical protein ACPGUI_00465 [Halarcobacter sp.]
MLENIEKLPKRYFEEVIELLCKMVKNNFIEKKGQILLFKDCLYSIELNEFFPRATGAIKTKSIKTYMSHRIKLNLNGVYGFSIYRGSKIKDSLWSIKECESEIENTTDGKLISKRLDAIHRFKVCNGKQWKSKLRDAWENGNYNKYIIANKEDIAYLQQCRREDSIDINNIKYEDDRKEVYRYMLNSQRESSARYGNCEVCKKHASEVFYQVEEKAFFNPVSSEHSWTQHNCNSTFGHKECLIGLRR